MLFRGEQTEIIKNYQHNKKNIICQTLHCCQPHSSHARSFKVESSGKFCGSQKRAKKAQTFRLEIHPVWAPNNKTRNAKVRTENGNLILLFVSIRAGGLTHTFRMWVGADHSTWGDVTFMLIFLALGKKTPKRGILSLVESFVRVRIWPESRQKKIKCHCVTGSGWMS